MFRGGIKLRILLRAFLFLMMICPAGFAQEPELTKYVQMAGAGEVEKAYKELLAADDKKLATDRLHLKYLALGNWAQQLKKYPESRDHFEHSRKLSAANGPYLDYLIGHSYKEEGKAEEALRSYAKAIDGRPSQDVAYLARFEMSEAAAKVGKLAKAHDNLQFLERHWRGTPKYPEVLWRLMSVEIKENRKYLACRWARKLFSRYAGEAILKDWTVDLPNNKVDGVSVGCAASEKEVQARMRSLQLYGAAQKARTEIDFIRAHARPSEKVHADLMLAGFYEMQGYPEEALQILLQRHDELKNNMGYQILLAKAATQSGEFQAAIGAYYNAYRLSPSSKNGRSALFSSAFLSYQIQDYDGASRRFSDLIRKSPTSGLARDARWHLAWIQYLKADYVGAEKSFRELYKQKVYVSRRKRRSTPQPFHNERTQYWLAMSLLRQNKFDEARSLLTSLQQSRGRSFYGLVAEARLSQFPSIVAPTATTAASAAPAPTPPEKVAAANARESEASSEENESEENLSVNDSSDDDTTSEGPDESQGPQLRAAGEPVEKGGDDKEEKVQATAFKDPKLRERFVRASDFSTVGLTDFAKWELNEIERRTVNHTYLRMLMDAYARVGSYNRMTYIAEVFFSGDRERGGFKDALDLWRFNFPQAYQDSVSKYAQQAGIPEALVYAIMRAESQFNSDAVSPVGARGLMQLMPYTAGQLTKLANEPNVEDSDLLRPEVNLRLGSRYLGRLMKKFSGQVALVAASYNAGPHRVNSWVGAFGALDMDEFAEHVPFLETRNYVKKVVRNFAIYSTLYSRGPATATTSLAWLIDPVSMKGPFKPSPRENWDSVE
jgi:soluble lytic murein transglycosylase